MKDLGKYRGCLLGGAAGDALGYPVEFLGENEIIGKYGPGGIQEYKLRQGLALISDDTQMTMFTATGLLVGTTRGMTRGVMGPYPGYIALAYGDWLRTQKPYPQEHCYSWLMNVRELFARRAPGNTCLSALESGQMGTIEEPINHSKGCGGIMRVAPIGIYLSGRDWALEYIVRVGAETAAITHGHELGYLPAAVLTGMIALLSGTQNCTLLSAIEKSMETVKRCFPEAEYMANLEEIVQKAIRLSQSPMEDLAAIHQLGEGWVAEETLAIAIYCALKYQEDFDRALIVSVNHKGDSDSTGAVTGNILGTYLGIEGIPQKYLEQLELKNVIAELADDLYNDCQIAEYVEYDDPIWEKKYVEMTYMPR